ncbi:SHOCT domain-containing protein [Pseudodesulfovibrio sp. zrk46]|uniref:SHOCT domain-containing protein n=1 Tax=Pseudodesulfovibrio sp. zrk46 TaxID=2725288 RepID=UPI00144A0BDC|nr:SHOCT domain-containing protein [Pseudodesulfovibrio sp. zrk46]QJB55416.1 SHOCT domain-containing protein [Pseudodesulfovibrio sp. zrk46]
MDILAIYHNWCTQPFFMGGNGWFGGYGFHFPPILMLLVIGLITYLVIRSVRRPTPDTGTTSPLDVLNRRYAMGEIDKATYEQMKSDIQSKGTFD